jgi:hypothetical protein
MQLCAPYMGTSTPLHTLCERVQRFLTELFVFVARPEAPAHNNLAERSMRPLVIARKIALTYPARADDVARYKNEIHALLIVLFPECTKVFADTSRSTALAWSSAIEVAQAMAAAGLKAITTT